MHANTNKDYKLTSQWHCVHFLENILTTLTGNTEKSGIRMSLQIKNWNEKLNIEKQQITYLTI